MAHLFKIEEIAYGWFEFRMGGKWLSCSDFMGNDFPKHLMSAVMGLAEGVSHEGREWLCCQDEPEANILSLQKAGDKLDIKIYDARRASYELEWTGEELRKDCGNCRLDITVTFAEMVDSLVTEFSLYENGNGLALYTTHWMEFPAGEYMRLKEYAYRLQEQMGEQWDDMFCTTYLESRSGGIVRQTS